MLFFLFFLPLHIFSPSGVVADANPSFLLQSVPLVVIVTCLPSPIYLHSSSSLNEEYQIVCDHCLERQSSCPCKIKSLAHCIVGQLSHLCLLQLNCYSVLSTSRQGTGVLLHSVPVFCIYPHLFSIMEFKQWYTKGSQEVFPLTEPRPVSLHPVPFYPSSSPAGHQLFHTLTGTLACCRGKKQTFPQQSKLALPAKRRMFDSWNEILPEISQI